MVRVYEGHRTNSPPFYFFFFHMLLCVGCCSNLSWLEWPDVNHPCCRYQHIDTILVVLVCIWSVHKQFICLNGSDRVITFNEFNISIYSVLWHYSYIIFIKINCSVSPYTRGQTAALILCSGCRWFWVMCTSDAFVPICWVLLPLIAANKSFYHSPMSASNLMDESYYPSLTLIFLDYFVMCIYSS